MTRCALAHAGVREQGVEQDGAVAVEHPLGIAGGAGGVAEHRGFVLVELRPLVVVGGAFDQLLVGGRIAQARPRHVLRVGQDDEALDGLEFRRQRLHHRHEGEVEEEHPILGVVHDVEQLVAEESRIHGVADRAYARDREVELVMAVGIPRERRQPIAGPDAERLERVGEPAHARGRVAVGVAVDSAFHPPGDHLRIGEVAFRVRDDAAHQERPVHDLAAHARSRRKSPSAPSALRPGEGARSLPPGSGSPLRGATARTASGWRSSPACRARARRAR